MNYTRYGNTFQSISHQQLLEEQKKTGDYWARVEESGSESCYVEVARWNYSVEAWQKFAFLKACEVRREDCGLHEGANDFEAAEYLADGINDAGYFKGAFPVIARMPAWNSPNPKEIST